MKYKPADTPLNEESAQKIAETAVLDLLRQGGFKKGHRDSAAQEILSGVFPEQGGNGYSLGTLASAVQAAYESHVNDSPANSREQTFLTYAQIAEATGMKKSSVVQKFHQKNNKYSLEREIPPGYKRGAGYKVNSGLFEAFPALIEAYPDLASQYYAQPEEPEEEIQHEEQPEDKERDYLTFDEIAKATGWQRTSVKHKSYQGKHKYTLVRARKPGSSRGIGFEINQALFDAFPGLRDAYPELAEQCHPIKEEKSHESDLEKIVSRRRPSAEPPAEQESEPPKMSREQEKEMIEEFLNNQQTYNIPGNIKDWQTAVDYILETHGDMESVPGYACIKKSLEQRGLLPENNPSFSDYIRTASISSCFEHNGITMVNKTQSKDIAKGIFGVTSPGDDYFSVEVLDIDEKPSRKGEKPRIKIELFPEPESTVQVRELLDFMQDRKLRHISASEDNIKEVIKKIRKR
ncbi:hypothetical protein GF345_00170 [Candidatus Woesearchaeota archaeon]|nr:hypothetical protein [Candidatus Woesearchaeota archaeon]